MDDVGPVAGFAASLRAIKDRSGKSYRALARPSLTSAAALHRYCTGEAVPPDFALVMRFAQANGAGRDELVRLHQQWLRARTSIETRDADEGEADLVPRQLPLEIGGFTGRVVELKELAAGLPLVVVTGPPGIGKTALVVHWAHQAADRFPDGQLYANLRGFDPAGPATSPNEVLRGFLDALSVPPQRIPANIEAQIGLYRSLIAGRRMLLILDNAHDADQVRPLLPGSGDSVAVVTSRNRLSGLVTVEGAQPVPIEQLSIVEARRLLARRVSPERTAAEPDAVDEIVAQCAGLPLALAIAAARAATRPRLPLAELAAELREAQGGLDPFADLRVVFSWSYHALSPAAARLFRLCAVATPDFTTAAAASLAGLPMRQVRRLLAELANANLIAEHAAGRYSLHDLLRAYAMELIDDSETAAAARGLADHYLQSTYAAGLVLHASHAGGPPPPPQPGTIVEPSFGGYQAMLAAIDLAAEHGLDAYARDLAWILGEFLHRQARWQECLAVHGRAILAARRLADRPSEAHCLRSLALAQARLGRRDEAFDNLGNAFELLHELGDRHGMARVHHSYAMAFEAAGDYDQALGHAKQAHLLFRATGDDSMGAKALNLIGWCHTRLGNHEEALARCQEALILLRDQGDLYGEAATLDSLGYAHQQLGHREQAVACYERAIKLAQDLGFHAQHTESLIHLGEAHAEAGEGDLARQAWQEALPILEDLHHPEASRLRDRLDQEIPMPSRKL